MFYTTEEALEDAEVYLVKLSGFYNFLSQSIKYL